MIGLLKIVIFHSCVSLPKGNLHIGYQGDGLTSKDAVFALAWNLVCLLRSSHRNFHRFPQWYTSDTPSCQISSPSWFKKVQSIWIPQLHSYHMLCKKSSENHLNLNEIQHTSIWLVVLTILKNISQWEGLSHILWKIKTVPNHQPAMSFLKQKPFKASMSCRDFPAKVPKCWNKATSSWSQACESAITRIRFRFPTILCLN